MCKRKVGNAVKRNDSKRKIKASLKNVLLPQPEGLLGVVIHKSLENISFQTIQDDLNQKICFVKGEHLCKIS